MFLLLKILLPNLASRRRGPWRSCRPRIEESTAATNVKPPVEQIQNTENIQLPPTETALLSQRSDLGDVEAHYKVEREDVLICANVDTPIRQTLSMRKL